MELDITGSVLMTAGVFLDHAVDTTCGANRIAINEDESVHHDFRKASGGSDVDVGTLAGRGSGIAVVSSPMVEGEVPVPGRVTGSFVAE